MSQPVTLGDVLHRATLARQNGLWLEALALYRQAEPVLKDNPVLNARVYQNMALCAFMSGDHGTANQLAGTALQLTPDFWQARLLKAKALRKLGQVEEAKSLLEAALAAGADLRIYGGEYADLTLNDFGDAVGARGIIEKLADDPLHREDACLTAITTSLYDRGDRSAAELVGDVCDFARAFLEPYAIAGLTPKGACQRERPRIGLISPFFGRTPVYYLGFGAAAELAKRADLYFFHRSLAKGAETSAFQALATQWIPCSDWGPERLAREMAAYDLDAILDMGGWSDVNGLRALVSKPARRMAKWVGGQSVTTGLACFDGWFSDAGQAAPEHAQYYVEPLVTLPAGYVTYTPPNAMPAPVPDTNDIPVLGVAANPAKVSRKFLAHIQEIAQRGSVIFRFIDRRYAAVSTRARIEKCLPGIKVEFVVPKSHYDYLSEIGKVSAILDTFPYTSGLTAVEAMALGVTVLSNPGVLFCERHAYAHRVACGAAPDYELELHDVLFGARGALRKSLLTGSPRLDHAALSDALFTHLTGY